MFMGYKKNTNNYFIKKDREISIQFSIDAMIVKDGYVYIRDYSKLPGNVRNKIETVLSDYGLELEFSKTDTTILAIPQFVLKGNQKKNLARTIGKIMGYISPKIFSINKKYNADIANPRRLYPKKLDAEKIIKHAKEFAEFIKLKKNKVIDLLLRYETYEVAADEINRTLDLLTNLSENAQYFQREVGVVATFMPRNQPLYAFSCFVIVPALMVKGVHLRPPVAMDCFFFDLMMLLRINYFFPNIHVTKEKREEFLRERLLYKTNKKTGEKEPVTHVVIFTGTPENAQRIRKLFDKRVLFIANGAGHNPIVVSYNANIDQAILSALKVQFYNQGQDCAGPNAILVHKKVYKKFSKKLKAEVKKIKVGLYKNRQNRIGPIGDYRDLARLQKLFIDNAEWLDSDAEGIIHTKSRIIEPTIIFKPLKNGGNYVEQFAPVFFVQRYDKDKDLKLYFENPQYVRNAMYITLFGNSRYINSLIGKRLYGGKIFHTKETIIRNTNLHAPGVERGTQPYGGYGIESSSYSIYGKIIAKPTLPQRDIYEQLVLPSIKYEKLLKKISLQKNNLKNHKTNKNTNITLVHPKIKEECRTLNSNLYPKCVSALSFNLSKQHWSQIIATNVLKTFPDKDVYTCAAGITPSGVVHFGNFRDVITSLAVVKQLRNQNKNVRFIFSWDDFDRFRKIPQNVDASFSKYIGLPLTAVPDPKREHNSYAERLEKEFEDSIEKLDIKIDYHYQTKEYQLGRYDELIIQSLQHHQEIADILLSFMSEKGKAKKRINPKEFRKNYFPISIYSRFSGKDYTKILNYDGKSRIKYKCLETGKIDIIDITKNHIVKLAWKVDWAMRWSFEDVVFEPGGADHAGSDGSYNVANVISKKIFHKEPPLFIGYQFVGLRGSGGKMSGSKGNVVSLSQLLEIYEPSLLKWMYLHRRPDEAFSLAFDSEIYRQYHGFDLEAEKYKKGELNPIQEQSLILSTDIKKLYNNPLPFRQAVAFGQIVQWDFKKIVILLNKLKLNYDKESIKSRLKKARDWLEIYNRDQIIKLREKINTEYVKKITPDAINKIRTLRKKLIKGVSSVEKLEKLVYGIPKNPSLSLKENVPLQRAFFKNVYNLLIGQDQGPRLATFLWAVDRKRVLQLLDI